MLTHLLVPPGNGMTACADRRAATAPAFPFD